MQLREIKELMASMVRGQISRLAIKREGFEIEIERSNGLCREEGFSESSQGPAIRRIHEHLPPSKDLALAERPVQKESGSSTDKFILSPMVGTFYKSPSPGAPPFVNVGDRIEKGMVVCIIEAMKVMNEVKATESGILLEVLIGSEEPIEFGSKLFRLQAE